MEPDYVREEAITAPDDVATDLHEALNTLTTLNQGCLRSRDLALAIGNVETGLLWTKQALEKADEGD